MADQSQTTLTLYPYGDTELHFASGDNWSLPLYVHWRLDRENNRHYALLTPPLGFYHTQLLCLQALLQAHDIMGRKDRWLIHRQMVEVLLHKAAGITPVAYYKWPEPDMPAIVLPSVLKVDKLNGVTTETIEDSGIMSSQEPFIKFIAEQTGINRSIIRVIFKAICDNAARWMLEKRTAIDFGFCKLFAAPFRPNWKEIVAFKFKKWKLLGLFNEKSKEALEDAGLPSALCSLHNIAIKQSERRQKYRISYTLEAVPNKRFEKVVDAVERSRLLSGTTGYVASFEKTVESLYWDLLSSLENYLHKTGLPFARIHERSQSGYLGFVPTTGQSYKVRGVGLRHLPQHIISADSPFSLLAERSDELLVQAQAPPMQAVPALPPPDEDMRESEQSTGVVEQGSEGAAGLSLLDAGQGKDEGQQLLPRLTIGTGDSSWVDGR